MASHEQQTNLVREAVGVFETAEALEAATAELLQNGFPRERLTLLAGEKAVAEKLGHKYERVEELEDDAAAPRISYRSRESVHAATGAALGALASIGALAVGGAIFATGGALAVTLGTGLIGAEVGGFLGGVLGDFLEERHAEYLHEQIAHGGLLLWVRTQSASEEKAAKDILLKHSGRDVHLHELAAGA
jgi:hypothetical protein